MVVETAPGAVSEREHAPRAGDPSLAQTRLLLVDPDVGLRRELARALRGYGFGVEEAPTAAAADALLTDSIDLVVLEPAMEQGLETCRRMVSRVSTPLIMLSSARDPIERIVGLELGADDYLSKPAEPRELVARIRAVLRRSAQRSQSAAIPRRASFGGWTVDLVRHQAISPGGRRAGLSRSEFELLSVFLAHPQEPLNAERLAELSGLNAAGNPFSVVTLVSRLRQRLNDCERGGAALIRTVRNSGYVLDALVRTG